MKILVNSLIKQKQKRKKHDNNYRKFVLLGIALAPHLSFSIDKKMLNKI